VISAIWHGFYPGFFIFFLGAGLLDYQAKLAGEALSPLVENKVPSWIVYVVCWAWCYIGCGYFCSAFVLLSFENSHIVYSSMYYVFHLALLFAIVVSLALMPAKKKKEASVTDKSKAE